MFVGSGCDDKSIVTVTPGATPKIEAHEVKTKVPTKRGLVSTQDVDARGRLWAADRLDGLAIIERDGSATTLKPGSIPAVSGDVNALAVVGGGPDKLPSAAEVATGAISGKVLNHGTPVAKAMVEMCRSPSSRFVESPCSIQPDRIRGETDDAGVFPASRARSRPTASSRRSRTAGTCCSTRSAAESARQQVLNRRDGRRKRDQVIRASRGARP